MKYVKSKLTRNAKRNRRKKVYCGPYDKPQKIKRSTSIADGFYESRAWLQLRYRALMKYGRRCQCCGAVPPVELHVDHVRPRSRFPELALELSNLQILCRSCNMGKSNIYLNDFRVIRRPALTNKM